MICFIRDNVGKMGRGGPAISSDEDYLPLFIFFKRVATEERSYNEGG